MTNSKSAIYIDINLPQSTENAIGVFTQISTVFLRGNKKRTGINMENLIAPQIRKKQQCGSYYNGIYGK
jgi:hypothetical protein